MPADDGRRAYEHDALRGNTPICHARHGHGDACQPRKEQGKEVAYCLFAHSHLLEEDGTWCDGETGDEEPEEGVAREVDEPLVVVVVGYEWRTKPEDDVDDGATHDVEPKDGVVVAMCGMPTVGECSHESAFLQRCSNGGIDAEHSHHTVVVAAEVKSEHDSEYYVEYLHRPVADKSPQQPASCLFF